MDKANAKFVLINDAGQENVIHKNSFSCYFQEKIVTENFP